MPAILGTVPSSSTTGSTVAVPDLQKATKEDAESILSWLGLKTSVVSVEAIGDEGTVYSQDPQPPKLVQRGSTVKLLVISNPSQPPDWEKLFGKLVEALDLLQTEEAAKERYEEVLAQIDRVPSEVAAKARHGELLTKISALESAVNSLRASQPGHTPVSKSPSGTSKSAESTA